ncbi:tetratricopeptide repeat protein [Roseivivax sediminis]|uniref:Tetratricopeptide repeat-containing protein n=1 Tax=Roseivivax sediminis TaxID=936889 RepID=A0A1I1SLK3_9RHOB|nr:hypothetical protein [Roseivivax sediminis]SFD47344.1 hypothetical protein SAMN04515678_101226 [Roseivivax sediminis]
MTTPSWKVDRQDGATAPTASPVHAGLINRQAWAVRWEDRKQSTDLAREVLSLRLPQGRQGPSVGLACRTLAWQAQWSGELDEAADFAAEALEILKDAPRMSVAVGDVQAVFANIYYARSRRDLARASIEAGFEAIGADEAVATRIDLLCAQAAVLRQGRHMKPAAETLLKAMSIAEGPEVARVHHDLARLFEADQAFEEAMSHAMRAVSGARAHSNRVILPYALEVLGACHRVRGAHDRARTYLAEGRAIAEADGDRRVLCQVLRQIALLEADGGQMQAALRAADRGLMIAREMTHPLLERQFLRLIAESYEALGDTDAALHAYKRLYHLLEADYE